MTKRKYNKSSKKSFSDKNLRLNKNVLEELSQKQATNYALENLRKVIMPLYSETCVMAGPCHVPLADYFCPYKFVKNQIGEITKFLLLNYDFYVKVCEVANVEEYFERVKNLNNFDCREALLETDFDLGETPLENVVAQVTAELFFEKLDELFKISMDDVIYAIPAILNALIDSE